MTITFTTKKDYRYYLSIGNDELQRCIYFISWGREDTDYSSEDGSVRITYATLDGCMFLRIRFWKITKWIKSWKR